MVQDERILDVEILLAHRKQGSDEVIIGVGASASTSWVREENHFLRRLCLAEAADSQITRWNLYRMEVPRRDSMKHATVE